MRILVAGSKRQVPGHQHEEFDRIARLIGGAVAQLRHSLLIESGDRITFDWHAARGFAKTLTEADRRTLPSDVCLEVHQTTTHPNYDVPSLPEGRVRIFTYNKPPEWLERDDSRLWARAAATAQADCLIAIGGNTGTTTFCSAASELKKPVIAIPAFGGAAEVHFPMQKSRYLADEFVSAHLSAIERPETERDVFRIIECAERLSGRHSYFLSYSHDDMDAADQIELLLTRSRRAVVRDQTRVRLGERDFFETVLIPAIGACETYVALWSPKFESSAACRRELKEAIKRREEGLRPRRIVIVAVDGSPIPEAYNSDLYFPATDRHLRELAVCKIVREE
ncbi:MAG: toll/interleukin-1 receptor domain-containing protein [Planctomyces sp.]|nr:toll/interleukin-1 receptor domain-containing protein [Planctomyces sp.]